MLNLFENYTEHEQDLEYSLHSLGQGRLTVVLNDNGFLPSHVVSPVGYFTGMDACKQEGQGKGRFFNDLNLPAYWEIRASGSEASIFEGYKKKGHIHYSQRSEDNRIIRAVEWLNDREGLRAIDLYNQNGFLFGRETYSDGGHALTTYFNAQGQEVLLFNHVVNTIQLHFNGKTHVFSDYITFVLFYFETAQLSTEDIVYNHLGNPYFIINALSARQSPSSSHHTLFWQELSAEMPGNMTEIFCSVNPTTMKIVVQDRSEYERLLAQVPSSSGVKLSYLGYVYSFSREAKMEPHLLIHTNSDQLDKIQDLIQGLSEIHFHISARTEMSNKLVSLENFSNVSLYPNVTTEELQTLVSESSIYLDVNHGGELDNIVRQSFDSNLLLFAFAQTLHNPRFISPSHVFDNENVSLLIEKIKTVRANPSLFDQALETQWEDAGHTTREAYQEVME